MTNLKQLYLTGASVSIYDTLTFVFLIPFALTLGASNTYIGLLSALTYIAALLSELPGAKLLDYFSRKRIVMWTTITARLGWLFMAFAPYIFKEHPLLWIFIIYTYIKLVEILHEPAWIELMADIVPTNKRGTVFAKRQVIIGWSGLITSLIAGWYLDLFPHNNSLGFSSLFAISLIFALLHFYSTSEIKEPLRQHHHHGFKDALTLSPTLRKYTAISALSNAAVMIASPFFTVYMLQNLHMTYTWFVISTGVMAISKILFQQHIGKLTDNVGDVPIMILSSLGISLVPFLFLFITPDLWWLTLPVHFIAGIAWAGFDLTKFNLLLDYTNPERRAAQTATYTMATSIPNAISPIIGGYIADTASIAGLNGIPLIFAIAALLRLLTGFLYNTLPEVRINRHYPLGMILRHFFLPLNQHDANTTIKAVIKHKR